MKRRRNTKATSGRTKATRKVKGKAKLTASPSLAKALVTEKHSEGVENVTEETVEVHVSTDADRPLIQPGAPLVKFGVGTTRSLAQPYEMLRLDVHIEVPYDPESGPNDAMAAAIEWAEERINELEQRYEVGK